VKKSFAFFVVLVIFLTACGVINPRASGTILYEDDFSNKRNGWGLMERAGGDIQIKYGGMLFSVDLPNFMFWSVTGRKYQDTQINVDAVLVEGPVNNAFGVICRYQDEENFYGFLISHDGYYGIYKYIDGNVIMATKDGTLGYSAVIRQGGVVNHLQAVCEGNRLSLSVNDTLLTEVVDDSFKEGKVGLIAGSYEDPGVNVLFDNFQVVQP
jgi:hypothetical protein